MSQTPINSKLEEYNRLSTLLEGIEQFIERHRIITYIEFDYYVVHDMILFSIEPDFNFEDLKQSLDHIRKSISAVKRIFKKPIIFLKDTTDVLPVENARVINQNTLLHLGNHAQYISNITEEGIKPRKLLTRIYEDEYGIYENIIFCNYIDEILSIVRKNRKILNSIYYASKMMQFNILEKGNHINTFLALGKLHTGYIRDFNQYYVLSKELLHELSSIDRAITPRLFKPVYKNNQKRNKKLRLKKTNIFLKQKDYRMVYKTYKQLLGSKRKADEDNTDIDFKALRKNYLLYVRILAVFSAGHFNFHADSDFKMDLRSLNVGFSFKGWKLHILNNKKEELLLEFIKDWTYRILLISNINDPDAIKEYERDTRLDEVIVVNHFEEDESTGNQVYISVEDIDSFRRIQQIILRGMIYSDTKRTVCPFCGGHLSKHPLHGHYQCDDCMIQIKEDKCPNTSKSYYYTDTTLQKVDTTNQNGVRDEDNFFYKREIESSMYFRNITNIVENGGIVCPHCQEVHKK
ncbi:MAG: hypothetical protein JXB08_03585 [Bacilli bacterium]|nr:hypothetical protein [Bacilli bacterium]MBN2876686.1 hypothetical protein [Bacilli bacterium]